MFIYLILLFSDFFSFVLAQGTTGRLVSTLLQQLDELHARQLEARELGGEAGGSI